MESTIQVLLGARADPLQGEAPAGGQLPKSNLKPRTLDRKQLLAMARTEEANMRVLTAKTIA